ncbi:MAG: hypothetical protein ACYTFZ_08195 [Planctomycetota bacterium]
MYRPLFCAALAIGILSSTGCHKGQVRLQVDPNSNRFKWCDPILAEEFTAECQGLLYVVEAPVGYAMARKQPLHGFAVNARARWDTAVEPLCERFRRLCSRHNRADITLQEFEDCRAELQTALGDLGSRRRRLDALLEALEATESALEESGQEPGAEEQHDRAALRAAARQLRIQADATLSAARKQVQDLCAERADRRPAG